MERGETGLLELGGGSSRPPPTHRRGHGAQASAAQTCRVMGTDRQLIPTGSAVGTGHSSSALGTGAHCRTVAARGRTPGPGCR